ncbi:MAG: hypothetical protein KY475_00830, partial [Planctomycetes bacterium]|nr:hypothetical protein [Planctomycetota bacterium]
QFEQAISSLKTVGAKEAANAAWMAFVSYKQLAEKTPRFTSAAIDVLQTIKREFPGHEYAKNADYHIARLQRDSGSPEEAIRNLASIRPGDPNYLTSRYDLCVLLHQQWSEAETAGAKKAALAQLQRAADEYLRAAGARGDAERQLRVMLLVVAGALGSDPPHAPLARQYVERAESLSDRVPVTSSALADYHYRALQLARIEKDEEASLRHAQWLAEHGRGSAYELSALIEVSRDLEKRLDGASESERENLHEEAYAVYTRLVERLGGSASSQRNVRVALSRLAEYAYATGRHEEAARRLAPLLETDPKNKDYLRRSGLANFQSGNFEAALANWRTLAHGLARGSEDWFEAKYYQIASLAETDADQARLALENLKLFYPDFGASPWREKFELLAQQL